jgi:hypothetical protein
MLLDMTQDGLPSVAGDAMEKTIAEHVQACRVLLMEEQEKPLPNNALISVLCDSIRLTREQERLVKSGITAECSYCKRSYPKDSSSPTNLFCAACRQNHHMYCEGKLRKISKIVNAPKESSISFLRDSLFSIKQILLDD